MPDTTQFNAPDTTKINWWYIGGGIAGVVLLIYLLNRNSSGSGGTVAAGTSINAALGSLQESALNQQGALSFAQKSIDTVQSTQTTGFTGVNNSIAASTTDINKNITNSTSGITDLINNDVNGINQELGTILGNEATTYNQLLDTRRYMQTAFGANSDKVTAIDAEIQSIFNEMTSGFSKLADELNKPVAVQDPPAQEAHSSGGSTGLVHTYTVYLPGGGAIHTNSSSAAGALNNVPGGHF